jgi:hypothetical protein
MEAQILEVQELELINIQTKSGAETGARSIPIFAFETHQ